MRTLRNLSVLFVAVLMVASLFAQAESDQVKETRAKAERGDAEAQFNLGNAYYNGEGVPQDAVEAYAWWNIAGSKGHENAQRSQGMLSLGWGGLRMTPAQIHQAPERTKELMKTIEEKGAKAAKK